MGKGNIMQSQNLSYFIDNFLPCADFGKYAIICNPAGVTVAQDCGVVTQLTIPIELCHGERERVTTSILLTRKPRSDDWVITGGDGFLKNAEQLTYNGPHAFALSFVDDLDGDSREFDILRLLDSAKAVYLDATLIESWSVGMSIIEFYTQTRTYSVRRDWLNFAKPGPKSGQFRNVECQTLGENVELYILGLSDKETP